MEEKDSTEGWITLYETVVDRAVALGWTVVYHDKADVEKAKPMVPTMLIKPHSMN